MRNFFRKLERLFFYLLIVTLIIVISVQILLKNENTRGYIERINYTISDLRNWYNQIDLKQKVIPVSDNEYVGSVTIDLLNDLSLAQVYVIKDGIKIKTFKEGVVRLTVKQGDIIKLDSRFYSDTLWFEITEVSPEISTWYKGQQFRLNGEIRELGIVNKYTEL